MLSAVVVFQREREREGEREGESEGERDGEGWRGIERD